MPLPDVAFLLVAGMVAGSDLFRQLVPFLVAAGSCVLLAAPRLTYWYAKAGGDRAWSATFAVALISVYGGYFGAGSGVMLLAATLVLTSRRIAEVNASKNMYLGAGGVASALILTTAAPVPWTSVAVLAGGLLVGSLVGPSSLGDCRRGSFAGPRQSSALRSPSSSLLTPCGSQENSQNHP